MRAALSTFWRALQYWGDEMFLLMPMNVAWWVAMLLVIPGPPMTAAILAVTHRMAHGELVSWRVAWEAFRRHFWRAWGWMAINLAFVALLYFNYTFYAQRLSGALWTVAWIGWLVLIAAWAALQLYWWPLMLEMPGASLVLALRNAIRLIVLNPLFTLVALVLSLTLAVVSVVFFPLALFISVGLLASIANHMTLDRLAAYREMRMRLGEEETEGPLLIGLGRPTGEPVVRPRPPRARRARRRQRRRGVPRRPTRR